MDSAAVFLFNLFIAEPQLTRSHAEEIKRTLGPFPASAATRASNTIKRIVTYLLKDSHFLNSDEESSTSEGSRNDSQEAETMQMKKEFGHNITFKYETEFGTGSRSTGLADKSRLLDDDSYVKSKLTSGKPSGYDSLSDGESGDESTGGSNIVMQTIINGMQQSRPHPPVRKSLDPQLSNVGGSSSVVTLAYGRDWLKEKCKGCVREGTLPWLDLYQAVFEVLSSSRDDAAIQNDVRFSLTHTYTHIEF